MTPKPQRRISLQLRLILAIVFIAFAYFVAQYRKSVPRARSTETSMDTRPLLVDDPSPEGTDRFAWVPAFPGAEIEGITSKVTRGQVSRGFHFRTARDFKTALAFYGDKLKGAGFKVDIKETTGQGGELHADSADGKRAFDVVAAKVFSGTGTEIGVTAVQR
jgi:hypothetical protein